MYFMRNGISLSNLYLCAGGNCILTHIWRTLCNRMFSTETASVAYQNQFRLQNSYKPLPVTIQSVRGKSTSVKYPKNAFPPLDESEIEEQIGYGTGPGGQSVNKTMNAVIVKHTPTGLTAKCHESRSLAENQKKAREMLQIKLDVHVNGEDGVVMKTQRKQEIKNESRKLKNQARQALKKSFKENLD